MISNEVVKRGARMTAGTSNISVTVHTNKVPQTLFFVEVKKMSQLVMMAIRINLHEVEKTVK